MKSSKLFSIRNVLLLIIAFSTGVFLSPKWMIPLAAWVHFAVLLRFYRDNNWKGFILSIPVLVIAAIIAQIEVYPMNVTSLAIFMLVGNTIGLLPFIVDRLTYKYLPDWAATLLFPAFYTAFNYFIDMGPQGTWGNSAYTQFGFSSLMQIASITGIYGVNFLLYWFASFTNYLIEKRIKKIKIHPVNWAMPITLALVLLYGIVRLNTGIETKERVSMATITLDNMSVMKTMYQSEFNTDIDIPKYISQSDPKIAELQKGMMAFMASPDSPRFEAVYSQMDTVLQQYSDATKEAAKEGAKIITWSEAAIINIKSKEATYVKKMARLADDLDVFLFFPTAVFHPEKVGKENKFIENKVLTFNPEGQLVNTYFKNIPIFGVEPSFPGDGTIPVIETPYGNLSPIICYDADHPKLIQQVSHQSTDLLVVPTGDWQAISPYHTYMAAVRCIENGVSMLKSTSNGLSAMIDHKGRILASYDYFNEAEVKMMVHKMPIQSSRTAYATFFPIFIKLLFVISGVLLLLAFVRFYLSKKKRTN